MEPHPSRLDHYCEDEFDRNDISWCQVFVETASGNLAKVFDDETC